MRTGATLARALVVLWTMSAVGCGGIGVHYRARGPARPPRDPSSVAIYTLTPPGLQYDVVGTLRAEAASFDMSSGPALLARLRDAAAANGCGALLIDHGYCVEDGGGTGYSITQSSLEVSCIEVRR